MEKLLLSVLIPLFNEEELVATLLDRALKAPLTINRELVVVDDASSDGSAEVVQEYMREHPEAPIRLVRHEQNQGKGAAIRTALEHARGELSIIQDADLEYDPREYPKLIDPIAEGRADVVYGSR